MSPSRDAFGFTSKTRPQSPQGTNPLTVVAQPGQEIRVVIADDGSDGGGQDSGDSGPRGSHSGDSGPRGSKSGSGDSGPRGSKSGSGYSGPRGSKSGSGDSGPRSSPSGDAFGFTPFPRGFSPTPITVVAHSGQEIRIVVPDRPDTSGT